MMLKKLMFILPLGFAPELLASTGAKDLLIKKMSKVHRQLSDQDPAKLGVSLRLADLLSERARSLAMQELEGTCQECPSSKKDREKALSIYRRAMPRLKSSQKGRVMAQMGHLYQLNGEAHKAKQLYLKISSNSKDAQAVSEAELSLAELAFKANKFKEALTYYTRVMGDQSSSRRGLAAYRVAWSNFRLGRVTKAVTVLRTMLETPELLTRNNQSSLSVVDEQFKEEVSRDLATFMAQVKPNQGDIKKLYELSPRKTRLENVSFLALELERLGKLNPSLLAWKFVQDKQSNPGEKLKGHFYLAKVYFGLNQHSKSLLEYSRAMELWRDQEGCGLDNCQEMRSRARNHLITWNKLEKKKASETLLEAYAEYLKTFPEDFEMDVYRGQAVAQLGAFDRSMSTYLDLFRASKEVDSKLLAKLNLTPETILLKYVEFAESSKKLELRKEAYDVYARESLSQSKLEDIKYQLVYLDYQSEKYSVASEGFYKIAVDSSFKNNSLRKKSAELAIDSLVLLKDDSKIALWSEEFARLFQSKRTEFAKTKNKALMNQSSQAATLEQGGSKKAWDFLSQIDLSTSAEEDKITFYKNKLILAQKLKKFQEAQETASKLLALKGLKKVDRDFALSRLAYFSELNLDFETAFSSYAKLETNAFKGAQKNLKLALLADVIGRDSSLYYRKVLNLEKDSAVKESIAAKLMEKQDYSLASLKKYARYIKSDQNFVGNKLLELFASDKNQREAVKKYFQSAKLTQATAYKSVERHYFYPKIHQFKKSIVSHELDGSTQQKLLKTMKKRLALLKRGESLLEQAAVASDWSSQMSLVAILSAENERLFNDILALPMPESLNEQQQQEYLTLLSQQASPHQVQAEQLSKKYDEFWQNGEKIILEYSKALNDEKKSELRALMFSELAFIEEYAPDSSKLKIAAVKTSLESIKEGEQKQTALPSLAAVEEAKKLLREDPLNSERIQHLIQYQKRLNNLAMVRYLEGRLSNMSKEIEGE